MNKELVDILEELRDIYEIEGDVYRENAYKKAIINIKKIDHQILTAPPWPIVGTRIANKITEFINTGRIAELAKLRNNKRVKAFRVFTAILGVGPATVQEWIRMRIYDIASLRRAIGTGKITLNHMQKLGLKYYSDLNNRMPRAEVEAIGEIMRRQLEQIRPGITFEISGSYRRGRADCGDIDILLTHNNWNKDLLAEFREQIAIDRNFIDIVGAGEQRLTLLYRGPTSNKVRQIDLLWLPRGQFIPALLYFTGSGDFNEKMRGIAKRKGYRLNQKGLFKIEGGQIKLPGIVLKTEREIFDILEMPYVEPNLR